MAAKLPSDLASLTLPEDVAGVLAAEGPHGLRLFLDAEQIQQAVYLYRPVFEGEQIVDLEVLMVNEAARKVPLSTHIIEGVFTSDVFVDHGVALDNAMAVWRGERAPTYHIERRGFHADQPIVVHYEVATSRVGDYIVQVSYDHTTVTQLASADIRFRLMAEASDSALVLLAKDSSTLQYLVVYANPAALKDVPSLRIGALLPRDAEVFLDGSLDELPRGEVLRRMVTREVLTRRSTFDVTISPVGTEEYMIAWRELTSEELAREELHRSDRVLQAIGSGAFGTIAVYEPQFDGDALSGLVMLWSASGHGSGSRTPLRPTSVLSNSDVLKMAQQMHTSGEPKRSGWVALDTGDDAERSVEFTLVQAGDRFVLEFVERTDELAARTALASVHATSEAQRSFLSRVSHEMRSPLNVIHGYSQLLSRLHLPEAALDYVGSIERGVGRMVQIVDDLLLLGQLDQGLVRVEPNPVSIVDLVDDLLDAAPNESWWTDGAMVPLVPLVPPGMNGVVRTDRARFVTVVLLLAEASRQVVPDLVLEVAPFARGARAGVQLVVPATSPVVEELWTPIVKSPTIPGSGLGLAVARGIAKVLDASIDVREVAHDRGRTALLVTLDPVA